VLVELIFLLLDAKKTFHIRLGVFSIATLHGFFHAWSFEKNTEPVGLWRYKPLQQSLFRRADHHEESAVFDDAQFAFGARFLES
jgi:hypothetical protein